MKWPTAGNLRILIIALYITIVVFLINFAFDYVVATYKLNFPYSSYVFTLAQLVSAIAIGYALISVMTSILEGYTSRRLDKVGTGIVKFFGQVIAYAILLLVIFDILNINPTSLLAASAVGGVILGLAMQNLLPIVFSGVLVGSSRNLTTGDVILLESYYWGVTTPKFLKVKKVGIVFTQFHDSGAHLVSVPNTLLLNSSIATRLEDKGVYKHSVNVNVKNDVPTQILDKYINRNLKSAFSNSNFNCPRACLMQNNDNTHVYAVTFYFDDIYEVDQIFDKIFKAVDDAYWAARDDKRARRYLT